DPEVLIMDEPISALDPLNRRATQEQLLELQSTLRKTILFDTHDLNDAMRLGDRIRVLRGGTVVQLGTGPQIIAQPADEYVHAFVYDVGRARALAPGSMMTEPWLTARLGDDVAAVLEKPVRTPLRGLFILHPDHRVVGVPRGEVLS